MSGTSAILNWQNGGGSIGLLRYRIYRGTDSTNVSLIDSTTSTSYVNAPLLAGVRYFYRVSAVDSTGFEGAKSYALSVLLGEHTPDANTVLLLHLNEAAGSTVVDASNYGNTGTAIGTAVTTGRFGYARRFLANADAIHVTRSSLKLSTFTAEAWIYLDAYAGNPANFIVSNLHSGVDKGYFLSLQPTHKLNFTLMGSPHLFSSSSIAAGKWYHVAASYDGTVMRLFINGVLDGSVNFSGLSYDADNSYPFKVGNHNLNPSDPQNQFFNGLIDEVRISNRVRSPNEFNLQLPPVNLAATAAGNTISLSWQNGGGAVGLLRYKIYRGLDSTSVALIDSTTSSSYTNSGLMYGTRYFYRVSAVDVTGFEGAVSYAVQAQIPVSSTLSAMSPSRVPSGSEFWINVRVGDPQTVNNLFGVSFDLTYTNTAYVDFVSADTSGSFLGTDLLHIITPNDANGVVSIGLSRKAPAGGVSGGGTLARVKFRVAPNAPINGTVTFNFSNVSANDPNGNPITLSPISSVTTIIHGVTVWPGDTDTSGVVNQGDILPLGLHWGRVGPTRQNASIQWIGQLASPWTPQGATYADANGDGVVNQADVLPIGLNWGKTHTLGKFVASYRSHREQGGFDALGTPVLRAVGPQSVTGKTDFDVYVSVGDSANPAIGLFGISFVLDFSGSKGVIQVIETTQGTLLGSDVIFFPQVDNVNGNVAFGITRKAGQSGVTGSGQLAKVRFKILNQTNIVTFSTRDIVANDPNGNAISVLPSSSSTLVSVEKERAAPDKFSLSQNYPNPFNPSTRIAFSIPKTCQVELRILDVLGRNVALLVDGERQPGFYEVECNAARLPSGIYLYRLQAGGFMATKKMLLLR
ncbi:MAG: T9SS type A sorting domain-containing protein [Ignavibacteria bacterium]|nr:T9SS type A sorting domain-containing protein [Ignavibacteria bacterium]